MEVLEERYITKYETLKLIEGEYSTSLIQNILENIRDFSEKEINIKKLDEIKQELKSIGLKENEITLILDFLPKSIEDLNILFGKNIKFFEEEKQKKIIDLVKKI